MQAIGAVNNVVRRADKTLFARNTDWGACTSAIEDGLREKEGERKLPRLKICYLYLWWLRDASSP